MSFTSAPTLTRAKGVVGVLFLEAGRYLITLMRKDRSHLTLCNRRERLEAAPDGSGFRCLWQWTSDLHAPKVLPFLGRWLMRRTLEEHPLALPGSVPEQTLAPDVSFIIGHRGLARLPHLLATLESIAGQKGASIECIVVEQDIEALLAERLPDWVNYIHTPPPSAQMPYCRSWTFNVGVKAARGKVVVLHDNDMLVPQDYAAEILSRIDQGYEVVNPKRFIFYLSQAHSEAIFSDRNALSSLPPETIVQNLEAGGSVAITRDAYERIGGMDESFVGWGGEDNEFWERAQTCRVWPYGYLPLVHLWHVPQPEKHHAQNLNLTHYRDVAALSEKDRIRQLREVDRGLLSGPYGYMSRDMQLCAE